MTTEKSKLYTGTGRRKTSTASIFMYAEKGDFKINDKDVNEFFLTEKDKLKWFKPFHAVGISHPTAQFSGTVKVQGSGKSSQMGAIVHAISRALAKYSEEFKKSLSKQGLLTRDSRMVERKKPYLRKARKAPQYSKR